MKSILIEKLENREIDVIEPLWNSLKDHHQALTSDYHNYYLQNTFDKRKAELLVKDRLAIFVTRDQQEVVGFCVVSARIETTDETTHETKPHTAQSLSAELDSLYVDQRYRDLGLGQQLAEAGIKWLEDMRPSSIRLLVGQGNEQVISFYQKLGFRQRAVMMQRIGD